MNKIYDNISKQFKIISFHDSKFENSKAIEFKIIILGEKGIGKTSICNRLIKNEFNLEIKSTNQNECYWKIFTLFDKTIYLYVIDIEDNFLVNERSQIYSNLDGAIIVYDITKAKSYEEIDKWISELKQNSNENIPHILLANKCDLLFLRNIDTEEGSKKALDLNCEFYETSCIEDKGFLDIFKFLVSKIYYNYMSEEDKSKYKINFIQSQNSNDLVGGINLNKNFENIKIGEKSEISMKQDNQFESESSENFSSNNTN